MEQWSASYTIHTPVTISGGKPSTRYVLRHLHDRNQWAQGHLASVRLVPSPLSQSRRVLLVGIPALVELTTARLMVALSISIFFLVLQHEHKPYATAEYNFLASLAGAQITATLLLISVQTTMPIPRIFGFLCVVLNVILLPLALCFNARRLRRRKDILNMFLLEHELERKVTEKGRVSLKKQASIATSDLFDPSHFSEYWKAGQRSEYEVFSATLDWIDGALERPVSDNRWGRIVFTLEQLPLSSSENADVRHGAGDSCPLIALCVRERDIIQNMLRSY